MADRERRVASTARPGDIINQAKQKRRTPEEVHAAKQAADLAKAEKAEAAASKTKKGVKRAAAVVADLAAQDECARATAAWPDLVTAQLKCDMVERTQQAEAKRLADEEQRLADEPDLTMDTHGEIHSDPGNEKGSDAEYRVSEGEADDSAGSDAEEDSASEDDTEAKIAAYAAALPGQKDKGKGKGKKPAAAAGARTKPKKGHLCEDIEAERGAGAPATSMKRKPSVETQNTPATKKPKVITGGLQPGWEKNVGLQKPPKKSTTSWSRSVSRSSGSPATSATSFSLPSGTSGDKGVEPGEFDLDDAQPASSVGRPAASASGTGKTGIILKKKILVVDVNGKPKQDPKPKYANGDLPFPADGRPKDLKHFQKTVIPDITDWAGSCEDAFAVNNDPQFKPTLESIWNTYFSAYPFTDAVEYVAGSAIRNWRSDIGKTGLRVVKEKMRELELATIGARRNWVADQVADMKFIYREPATKKGSYRSDLVLRTFGSAHLRIVLKSDGSFGSQIGAMAVCVAAVERGLSLWKTGSLSTEGVARKGKKTALSFLASPWADRALSYLPPIKTLSQTKWAEIYQLASAYQHLSDAQVAEDILANVSSTDDSAQEPYIDPRSRVVVSDDEDE